MVDHPPDAEPQIQAPNAIAIVALATEHSYDVEEGRMLLERTIIPAIHPRLEQRIRMLADQQSHDDFIDIYKKISNPAKRSRALTIYQTRAFQRRTADSFALLRMAYGTLASDAAHPMQATLSKKEYGLAKSTYALALLERDHDFVSALELWESALTDWESIANEDNIAADFTNVDILMGHNHLNIALAYSRMGNKAKGLEHLAKVIQLLQTTPSLDGQLIANLNCISAWIFERFDMLEDAAAIAANAHAAFNAVDEARMTLPEKPTEADLQATGLQGLAYLLLKTAYRTPERYTDLRLDSTEGLLSVLLRQGDLRGAQDTDATIGEYTRELPHEQQQVIFGQTQFAWGQYHLHAYQVARDMRERMDDSVVPLDANTVDQHYAAAEWALNAAYGAHREAGRSYHAAEDTLYLWHLRSIAGRIEENDRPAAIAAVSSAVQHIESHTGIPLHHLLNHVGLTAFNPPVLATAKQLICQLFPAVDETHSYGLFLQEYHRTRAQELQSTFSQTADDDTEPVTPEQVFAALRDTIDAVNMDTFTADDISQCSGLMHAISEALSQPLTSGTDVIHALADMGRPLILRHFYPRELLQDEAIETAIVTHSDGQLLCVILDPKRYTSLGYEEQINTIHTLQLLDTSADSTTLDRIIDESCVGACTPESDTAPRITDMIVRTFLETKKQKSPAGGDIIYAVHQPARTIDRRLPDAALQPAVPIAAARAICIGDVEPGTSRTERYLGITDEGTIHGIPREQIGEGGAMAIARAFRSNPKTVPKLFSGFVVYSEQHGLTHWTLTANKLTRRLFKRICLPFDDLGFADPALVGEVQDESDIKKNDNHTIILSVDDLKSMCSRQLAN